MSEHTTHIPETRLLQRSRSDRMVAGVAGGLARYFDIHPAVFRVGFVVLTLLGGAGILIYAVAALAMPDEGKRDSIATAALRDRRDRPWPLIGLGLLAVAVVILLSRSTLWFDGGAWWLFLIAGGLILWLTRQAATTEPDADAKQLAAADSRRLRRALRRLTIVLASIVALIVVAVAIFMAVFDVHLGRGIGERQYTVGSVQELNNDYRLGIGSLELDLSDVRFPAGETRVETSVDVGDLEVIVPAGVAVRAHGKAQVGYVNILGETDDGRNADVDVSQAGNRVLVLDADVGAGALRVHRAVR
jgi:phage shock protein PspC (stress-responsive transcriptional regulator)